MNAPYSFLPIQEKNVVLLARFIEAYSYGYMYYLHLIICGYIGGVGYIILGGMRSSQLYQDLQQLHQLRNPSSV